MSILHKTKNSEPALLDKDTLLKIAQPFPKCEGIYFLFDGEEIVYVGQSKDVCRRVGNHRLKKREHEPKTFDKFAFIQCDAEKIDEIETFYIAKFNPKYNNHLPNGVKSKWTSVNYLKTKYYDAFTERELRIFIENSGIPIIKKSVDINLLNAALVKKFGTSKPERVKQKRDEADPLDAERRRKRRERARLELKEYRARPIVSISPTPPHSHFENRKVAKWKQKK